MELKITLKEIQEQANLLETEINKSQDADDIYFQESASVLIRFIPESLKPNKKEIVNKKWENFFIYSEPIKSKTDENWWQLRTDIRRAVLKRLGSRNKMLDALATNSDHPRNNEQELFDSVIQNNSIEFKDKTREDLIILSKIFEWLKDILPVSKDFNEILTALPRADLLASMQRLATRYFVGRKAELLSIANYVGVKPEIGFLKSAERFVRSFFTDLNKNPPFLIYGPGGIGKSTLLAKFIIEESEGKSTTPLPFAYLDIDNSVLELERTETFVIEAARQLSIQIPEQKEQFLHLKDNFEEESARLDVYEHSKSYFSSKDAAKEFGKIICKVETPVLLVIDTFEEAQYLGIDVVENIWSLLVSLQEAAPNLRTIVAGRALVKDFPVKPLELIELSREEGQQLLRSNLSDFKIEEPVSDSLINEIINVVGLNPMSLRLAMTIVQEQGIEKLKNIETRNWFIVKIRNEVLQARLYGRILAHIHDEQVKKLAYPGLILRRINSQIILKVLAIPCGLDLKNEWEAELLMEKFSKEVSLVEPDSELGTICHRQDIRRVMLPDIKDEISEMVIKNIHTAAINYYKNFDDDISRAEEIYHHLSRGDDPLLFENRWRNGLDSRLRNALEELPDKSRIWLSNKLRITPDEKLLEQSDLKSWEEITATRVQRYLLSGNALEALNALRQRKKRSSGSELYRLELETLRILGRYEEASLVAEKALSESYDYVLVTLEINLQAALIKEAQGLIEEALVFIENASSLIKSGIQNDTLLRILTTNIRLLRKKGDAANPEREKLIEKVRKNISEPLVIESLRNHPALVRELVAEVGKIIPQLLQKGIDWLGLDVRTDEQANALTQALLNWNNELLSGDAKGLGELVERAGIKKNSLNDWSNFIKRNVGKKLSQTVQHWRNELLANETNNNEAITNFDKAVVDIYRNNVENSINVNNSTTDRW